MRLTSRSGPAERLRGFILVILWAKTAGLSARRQRYAPRIASLGRLLPKKATPVARPGRKARGQDPRGPDGWAAEVRARLAQGKQASRTRGTYRCRPRLLKSPARRAYQRRRRADRA